jgi:hypothetical protein
VQKACPQVHFLHGLQSPCRVFFPTLAFSDNALKRMRECRIDDWKIDLSSRSSLGCDPHGWHYGFNFATLLFQGRTHAVHVLPCVRRRRWVRTRVVDTWGPVTPDMQRLLTPARRAVCPSALGSNSSPSTPRSRSNSPDVMHSPAGVNGLGRRSSPAGNTGRRHGSADAASSDHSGLLPADNGASHSTSVSQLSCAEHAAADECQFALDSPQGSRLDESAGLRGGHSGACSSVYHCGDRLRGGSSHDSADIDQVLTVERSAASSPARMFINCGLSEDVSPEYETSAGPSSPVPSHTPTSLSNSSRGLLKGSRVADGRSTVKNLRFLSEDLEKQSEDLLRMYSERMYGSSFS